VGLATPGGALRYEDQRNERTHASASRFALVRMRGVISIVSRWVKQIAATIWLVGSPPRSNYRLKSESRGKVKSLTNLNGHSAAAISRDRGL
jgi:hypothetical protein